MDELKVALWNGGRVFSDELRYGDFVNGVKQLNADILVVPEALESNGEDIDPDFVSTLRYDQAITVPYKDEVPHPSGEQYIRVLGRVPILEAEPIRLGTRNAISLRLGEPAMHLIAKHADDRDEKTRQGMAMSAIFDHANPQEPTAIITDNNSARINNARTWLLANTMPMLTHLPHRRIKSLSSRLVEMLDGGTLRMFERAGFRDADPTAQPTSFQSIGGLTVKIAQLDRILTNPRLEAVDFQVHKLPGSDQHFPISATLRPYLT